VPGANLKGATTCGSWTTGLVAVDIDGKKINFDLQNLPLCGTNFRDANLSGANLDGADLRGALFTDANMENTNFSNTNLNGAVFDGNLPLKLTGANFSGATTTHCIGCPAAK